MEINCVINGIKYTESLAADEMAIDFLRRLGNLSVKRGCETSNCGLCSILVDDQVVLSCSTLAPSLRGKTIYTLEGLKAEAETIGTYMAEEGTEQCGYCSPGFIMNVIAMKKELVNPSDDEIGKYMAGNLCRCSGYAGQLRAMRKYIGGQKDA